jgi:ABC-type cobalamin transport system ATPase subunit
MRIKLLVASIVEWKKSRELLTPTLSTLLARLLGLSSILGASIFRGASLPSCGLANVRRLKLFLSSHKNNKLLKNNDMQLYKVVLAGS